MAGRTGLAAKRREQAAPDTVNGWCGVDQGVVVTGRAGREVAIVGRGAVAVVEGIVGNQLHEIGRVLAAGGQATEAPFEADISLATEQAGVATTALANAAVIEEVACLKLIDGVDSRGDFLPAFHADTAARIAAGL